MRRRNLASNPFDSKVKPFTLDIAKLKSKLSLDFGINVEDVNIETIAGEKYCVLTKRGVNKTCDGAIQYLEGNYSFQSSERISIQRIYCAEQTVKFLIPYTDANKYPVYADVDQAVTVRNRYIFLNDCFSQLLGFHLQPDEYEFKGIQLIIKKKMQDLAFMQPLFNSSKFKSCAEEIDGKVIINFDSVNPKCALINYGYADLGNLFNDLSTPENPVAWTDFPITYLAERFNSLLPLNKRDAHCVYGKKTSNKDLDGPVIKIPLSTATAQALRTHLYILEKFEFIDDNKALYIRPDVARKLFLTVYVDPYEKLFAEFANEQKQIARMINETKMLILGFYKRHIVIQYKVGNNIEFLGAFDAKSITLASIDNTILMCTRFIKLKLMLSLFSKLFSFKHDKGKLFITPYYAVEILQLGMLGAKPKATPAGDIIYVIDMYDMLNVDEDELFTIKNRWLELSDRINVKDKFVEELCRTLKSKKVSATMTADHLTICLPSIEAVAVATPLLQLIGASAQSNSYDFVVAFSSLESFMHGNYRSAFAAIQVRQQMITLYSITKNLYGDALVSAVKKALASESDVVISEQFFALGLERLQSIRKSVEALLAEQKLLAEKNKEAVLRSQITTKKESDDDKPVRVILQKKPASNSKLAHKTVTPKIIQTAKKSSPKSGLKNISSKTSKTVVSSQKQNSFTRQQNLVQPENRGAPVLDTASYYDFSFNKQRNPAERVETNSDKFGLFSIDFSSNIAITVKKVLFSIIFSTNRFLSKYDDICKKVDVTKTCWQDFKADDEPNLPVTLCIVQDGLELLGKMNKTIKEKRINTDFDSSMLAFLQDCEDRMHSEKLDNLHEFAVQVIRLTNDKNSLSLGK